MEKQDIEKGVYAPGELEAVRKRLGAIDKDEANRISKLLGGKVGTEREQEPTVPLHSRGNRKVGGKAKKEDQTHAGKVKADSKAKAASRVKTLSEDDPTVPIKANYKNRVEMDRYAADPEFGIKSGGQVFVSIASLFNAPPDYVNPLFVKQKLDKYYKVVEQMVISTRTMLPRNNKTRDEQLQKCSPLAFSIIDVLRRVGIEQMSSDMRVVQANPRHTLVIDLSDILRVVYRPVYLVELLDPEIHIRGSYNILSTVLVQEGVFSPQQCQELTNAAIEAFTTMRLKLHFSLYPLLMKLISDRFIPYNQFFQERKNRFCHFLHVQETDRINPEELIPSAPSEETQEAESTVKSTVQSTENQALKLVNQGLTILETLFPQSNWIHVNDAPPDLYPYFKPLLDLKYGYELIAPHDPLLQCAVLSQTLEELFFGLHLARWTAIPGTEITEDSIGNIINNWHNFIEIGFQKEYLPRLLEYCKNVESDSDSSRAPFARRLASDLCWIKKLFFFPYYAQKAEYPSPFLKGESVALYAEVHKLHKYLTHIANAINQANRAGGATAQTPCAGIENPWEPYNFQLPNPLSKRLAILLPEKKRTNTSLIMFVLSILTVLDYLMNNEQSWTYREEQIPLFRSVNGEGITPQFGTDTKIDPDMLFKQAIKAMQQKQANS
ncbi:MAG: hypothetical protein LBQ77_03835 [Treponema sp.]|nr:hypothetical protein [Treponema sp.]